MLKVGNRLSPPRVEGQLVGGERAATADDEEAHAVHAEGDVLNGGPRHGVVPGSVHTWRVCNSPGHGATPV